MAFQVDRVITRIAITKGMSALPPYLHNLNYPAIFRKALNKAGWQVENLTFEALSDIFDDRRYKFRLGRKQSIDVVWEGRPSDAVES